MLAFTDEDECNREKLLFAGFLFQFARAKYRTLRAKVNSKGQK